jgi:hypothetical protein
MMTFKDELRKYPWPRSSAINAHAKRWLKDNRNEEIWRKVSKAAGERLTAGEFIRFVVKARSRAAGLPHILDQAGRYRAGILAHHERCIKAALKSRKLLDEIADVLENAAMDFRLFEKLTLHDLEKYPEGTISRKNQKGSQARRAFCLLLLGFFEQKCKMWMENEVAALLDIALPQRGRDATNISEVRGYRISAESRDAAPLH